MRSPWIHIVLILLILQNGMGYTLIQTQFYLDREEITALYCVNKDKPELQCDGKCELGKRLSQAKDYQENEAEITLEELSLTFLHTKVEIQVTEQKVKIPIIHQGFYSIVQNSERGLDFFHPPKG